MNSHACCPARAAAFRRQTFWTLTANPRVLKSATVRDTAVRLGATPQQVLFSWLIASGHQPMTGTTSRAHMAQDLEAPSLALTPAEMDAIGALFASNEEGDAPGGGGVRRFLGALFG
jgi:diketogulonate reductase-like aldo/keto reductase